MLGYSASGSLIDYYNTADGNDGTGFATELTAGTEVNCLTFPGALDQVWVDSIRAINYTMFRQAIDPQAVPFHGSAAAPPTSSTRRSSATTTPMAPATSARPARRPAAPLPRHADAVLLGPQPPRRPPSSTQSVRISPRADRPADVRLARARQRRAARACRPRRSLVRAAEAPGSSPAATCRHRRRGACAGQARPRRCRQIGSTKLTSASSTSPTAPTRSTRVCAVSRARPTTPCRSATSSAAPPRTRRRTGRSSRPPGRPPAARRWAPTAAADHLRRVAASARAASGSSARCCPTRPRTSTTRYGLQNYAVTYTGYTLLENMLRHANPGRAECRRRKVVRLRPARGARGLRVRVNGKRVRVTGNRVTVHTRRATVRVRYRLPDGRIVHRTRIVRARC